MSKSSIGAVAVAHDVLARRVRPGDFCIDATAGRGGDTAYLCSLVGPEGRVLAFDVQQDAVDSANALLREQGFSHIGKAILDSHANMAQHVQPDTVSAIMFNLGWLPGGDHSVFTCPETTIPAIEQGLTLLKPGGVMSICIYYGRDCGFEERDAVLRYLETVDFRRYTVFAGSFLNRPNNPPIPVFLTRDE